MRKRGYKERSPWQKKEWSRRYRANKVAKKARKKNRST
jgi:hypothetical protein